MAKPTDWLGGFIERELQALVSWRNSTKDIYDGSSRFEDDGSNLRSSIQASSLPEDPLVQIIKIVSDRSPVVAVITDGYTQVKAKLLNGAVATLESEIGEELSLETKGDFVTIQDATVTATPYGPKDEHVQLEINEIEYKYHLRKLLGPAQPILERSEVARLLKEITEIRNRQHDALESYAEPESTGSNATAAAATAGASRDGHRNLTDENRRLQSQAAASQISSSPPSLTQQSYNTPNAIATQVSNRKKRKAPSFAEDGREILQGNNLARPHGPGFSVPTTRSPPSKRRQSDDTTKKLLGLLGSKPQGPSVQRKPATVREASVDSDVQSAHSYPKTQRGSSAAPKPLVIEIDDESASASPSLPAAEPDISGGVEQMSLDVVAEAPDQTAKSSSTELRLALQFERRHYGRRRIQIDQKTLLDKAGSWLPPLPGNQFPQGNVPISLLERWNEQPQSASWVVNTTRAPNEDEVRMADDDDVADDLDSSSDESDVSDDGDHLVTEQLQGRRLATAKDPADQAELDDDDSDAELPWGSSPAAVPPRKAQLLPPDSSIGSDAPSSQPPSRSIRPMERPQSAWSDRHRLPPDSSKGSSVASTPLQKQTVHSLEVSRDSTGRHGPSPYDGSVVNRTQASPSLAIRGQHSPDNAPETASRDQSAQPRSMVPAIQHTSPAQVNSLQTPNNPRQASRPSTSASIVKATPLENNKDDDMDMEMSVPRSLEHSWEQVEEQDPRIAYQKRRSAHFRPRQREKWLRTNYTYNPAAATFSVIAILKKYKAAYPKDKDFSLPEFVEALETIFPQLKPNASGDAVGGLMKIPDKAASASHAEATKSTTVRDSSLGDVEMTDADLEPVDTAELLRSVRPEASKEIATHPTNDEAGTVPSNRASSVTIQSTSSADTTNKHQRGSSAASSGITIPNAYKDVEMMSDEPPDTALSVDTNGEASIPEGDVKKSVFGEFEQAMKNVRPGGAFAKQGADGRKPGRRFAHLDVMSWDI